MDRDLKALLNRDTLVTALACATLSVFLVVYAPLFIGVPAALLVFGLGAMIVALLVKARILAEIADETIEAYAELAKQSMVTATYVAFLQNLLTESVSEMKEAKTPNAVNVDTAFKAAFALHAKMSPFVSDETKDLIDRLLPDEGGIVI